MPAWNRKPRETKKGEVRHSVGYVDENGVERTKGGFSKQRGSGGSNEWIKRYRAAEARGRGELRAFLDYEVRGISPDEPTTGCETVEQAMAEYLLLSHPDAPDGLAVQTHRSYMQTYAKHVRPHLATRPITDLAGPRPVAEMRDAMIKDRVGAPTIKRAIAVLSSMLSWAVEKEKLEANGARMLRQGKRRSNRRSKSEASSGAGRRSGRRKPSWALSPEAAAHVVIELATAPNTIFLRRLRDATVAVVQYLTGARNQDIWGLRWQDVDDAGFVHFEEFVSGGLLTLGKVAGSERSAPRDDTLADWLAAWRAAAAGSGLGTAPSDFVFPGNAQEGHVTENQTKSYGRRFKRACHRVRDRVPRLAYVEHATPYALRRGHISVRLRGGEDASRIASECATSVQMIVRYYWKDIEATDDSRDPVDVQFARAWREISGTSRPPVG